MRRDPYHGHGRCHPFGTQDSCRHQNARAYLAVAKEYGSFDRYLWGYTKGKTLFTKGMGQGPSRPPMAYPGLSAGTLRSGAFPLSDLSPFIPILKLSASSTIMMNHVLAIKRSLASAMRSGPIPLKKADLLKGPRL